MIHSRYMRIFLHNLCNSVGGDFGLSGSLGVGRCHGPIFCCFININTIDLANSAMGLHLTQVTCFMWLIHHLHLVEPLLSSAVQTSNLGHNGLHEGPSFKLSLD